MKSFNDQLHEKSELPMIKMEADPRRIKMFGGNKLLFPSALEINAIIAQIPEGKLIRADQIRTYLANVHDADYTCPITTARFMVLSAKAAEERGDNAVPYWRALGNNGQLNVRYPGGVENQRKRLEQEGFTIISKGSSHIVENVDRYLYNI